MNKNGATYQGKKPNGEAPKTRGRKVASKELSNDIKLSFDTLNAELKQAGYELVLRRPVSKELMIFDYGLMFTQGSNEVKIYVDDDLKVVIDHLLETNETVIIKSNWMSPDTVAITVPCELTGATERHENIVQVVE